MNKKYTKAVLAAAIIAPAATATTIKIKPETKQIEQYGKYERPNFTLTNIESVNGYYTFTLTALNASDQKNKDVVVRLQAKDANGT